VSQRQMERLTRFAIPIMEDAQREATVAEINLATARKKEDENEKILVRTKVRHSKDQTLQDLYGESVVTIDLSLDGDYDFFNTKYPYHKIRVPFTPDDKPIYAPSIEKIFEGFKIFGNESKVNPGVFNASKRNTSKEPFKGWLKGLKGNEFMTIEEAYWYLVLKPFKDLLETTHRKDYKRVRKLVEKSKKAVLIDKSITANYRHNRVLSGNILLKLYLDGNYPTGPQALPLINSKSKH